MLKNIFVRLHKYTIQSRHHTTTKEKEKFAVATIDTSFKHMLSLSTGSCASIVISFLNNLVPAFRLDKIENIREAPTAIPVLKRKGEKQTFMDLHVVTCKGVRYIIEVQAKRHVMFDERVLFYACSTYAHQLSEDVRESKDWYLNLKPVIALQILDYDTNRITGIKTVGGAQDTSVERVKNNKLSKSQFIKHYLFTEQLSGQIVEYLQVVQVELPRAEINKKLFPPRPNFSELDWWLSLLRHADEYTFEQVEILHSKDTAKENRMPDVIYKAFERLEFQKWSPELQQEYKEDIVQKELFTTIFAVERKEGIEEGRKEWIVEGKMNTARKLKSKGFSTKDIVELTEINSETIEAL